MERELRNLLDREWPDYVMEKTDGGHLRVTLRSGEESRFVICSRTPGDYRSFDNSKALLRRTMRALSGPRAIEKKPKEKRPTRQMKPTEAPYTIADKLRTEQKPKRRTAHVLVSAVDPSVRVYDSRVNLNLWRSKPEAVEPEAVEPEAVEPEAEVRKQNKWGSPGWREQLAKNAAKARAAKAAKAAKCTTSAETRQRISEAMKASWERRRAKLAAAAAPKPEPKPRIKVAAISVRTPTAPIQKAPTRIGIARAARLSHRRSRME